MSQAPRYHPHSASTEKRPDGSILLTSRDPVPTAVDRVTDWLHLWADRTPDRVFIAERSGAGWRSETYAACLQKVRSIAAALLARGLDETSAIMILSGNSVDHALLVLAAHYVGVPVAPLAEQYALIDGAHGRLVECAELVRPALVYAEKADKFAKALDLDVFEGADIIVSDPGARSDLTTLSDLLAGDTAADLNAAQRKVTPDSVAKILMTSGSTSAPKGVLTTHRMMCVNQAQLAQALPFLTERPPLLLDWLPWNHVFGGSHNFNMILSNGGTLYIDDGKPGPGLFDRTLENMRLAPGTLSFNVPVGYSLLAKALAADPALKQSFFADLDLIFYAGASLEQDVWRALEDMSMDISGRVPLMTSSWGLTETAPAVLLQSEPIRRSGVVGVPLAGTTVKLVPCDEDRFDVRVKGDVITPGYLNAPEKTKSAFDDDGFFITGDAMKFIDPDAPNKGLKFDGRLSEDFKLMTGTWVRTAQIRLDALSWLAPLAADVIVVGADRSEIGLLIFPNLGALKAMQVDSSPDGGLMVGPELFDQIAQRIKAGTGPNASSSTRIARAIVLRDPASLADGEITAKGSLNLSRILGRRSDLVDRLYSESDPAVIKL